MTALKQTIVVDADACPVKTEIAETARTFGVAVCMVASHDHRMSPQDGVQIVQVDRSDQSVDLYIVNHISKRDIVVTQDFGLACISLAKGAIVLSPRGEQYTDENIDYLMERRHEGARIRRNGGRTRGPKAMTTSDRIAFQQKLTKVLQNEQEKHDV
ncbi:YaiI/YqxD family protein [Paenibacillus sp. GSMTC-2017]|uniref:YaiI/YqxD family protein n=1 Tax=Paenibacillus sp. GSMTC-2017 TaxID=2794350 RepID=UPI0018D846FE|nr:YaiI/YqxD family protein [Paenibacillus sp. GSMTC-2017]MBH5318119.1 YaiI/YqxD family protein [Paenibacillus sp. GSMTC-2017]